MLERKVWRELERVGKITYLPIYMVMFMAASGLPERLIYRV